MRVLLWGINYAPEQVGIAPFNRELCEHLVAAGHEVTAVTAFSYYPRWRKAPADKRCWHRLEVIDGVKVHRCWCHVPAIVTTGGRIVHELTFGFFSMLRVLLLPRADVYFVVSPPLVLGFFAWIATRLKRSRFIFHVQDLQPDAAVGLAMLKPGLLVRGLFRLERFAYKKAAVVGGISNGMMTSFHEKGVPPGRQALLPNWLRADSVAIRSASARAIARARFGVPEGARLGIYAGNLGRKQSLGILLEAAALLAAEARVCPRATRLIIAGDGAARAGLEARLRTNPDIAVELLPLLSEPDYQALLAAADFALITQAAGSGRFFFPSKLLSVLAAGLPVVAVADSTSELARAVDEGGFGCTVVPGDARALAAVWRSLEDSDEQLHAWRARTAWVRQFSSEAILPRFVDVLIAASRRRAVTLKPLRESVAVS